MNQSYLIDSPQLSLDFVEPPDSIVLETRKRSTLTSAASLIVQVQFGKSHAKLRRKQTHG